MTKRSCQCLCAFFVHCWPCPLPGKTLTCTVGVCKNPDISYITLVVPISMRFDKPEQCFPCLLPELMLGGGVFRSVTSGCRLKVVLFTSVVKSKIGKCFMGYSSYCH
jgi:hypothetical protein